MRILEVENTKKKELLPLHDKPAMIKSCTDNSKENVDFFNT